MSLDMPFYEELRRQGHPAARTWFVGDRLYYVGLLIAFLAMAGGAISVVGALAGWFGWLYLLLTAGLFVLGAGVFLAGASLKGRSYRVAARDGINVDDY